MNDHFRTIVLRVVGVLLACLLGSGVGSPPANAAAALQTIRIATNNDQGGTTPFQNAIDAGLFEKAGIRVEITAMKSGPAIAAAVAGGAVDLGKSSILSLIIAHSHGIGFQIVGPAGLYEAAKPDIGLFISKSSSIRTAKDLVGKTIAVSGLGGLFQISAQAWLEQNGVDPSTVHFIEISTTLIAPAILKGTVDAGALANLAYQQAVDLGTLTVLAPIASSLANRFPESVWFGLSSFTEKNRDLVTRFERVIQQADADANKGLSRAYFQSVIEPADIQSVINSAAKYKAIDKVYPAREIISSTALKK